MTEAPGSPAGSNGQDRHRQSRASPGHTKTAPKKTALAKEHGATDTDIR